MRVCVDATIEGAGGNGPAPERGPARCRRRNAFVATKRVLLSPSMSARASRHPRLTQRLNRRPPFSPRCVLSFRICFGIWNVSQISSRSELKKKNGFHRSDFRPLDYHVMPPPNHLAAPSAHTRAHRARGVSARRRSPRVGDVVGIGAAAPPVPGGVVGVGTREAWLLRVPDFEDEI